MTVKIRTRKKFLAAGKACMDIYRHAPALKGGHLSALLSQHRPTFTTPHLWAGELGGLGIEISLGDIPQH